MHLTSMNQLDVDGWKESAEAWLDEMGDEGDYARKFILDAPMLERVAGRGFRRALDVGCGEGRFCRMLQGLGMETVGVDPTVVLIERARTLDGAGEYRIETAEGMDVAPGSFDLVVSYLSLIDIPDLARATAKMAEALRPGGTMLIANLTSFNTAALPDGWVRGGVGGRRFCIDNYLEERAQWVTWRGVRIRNWHRPLSTYMTLFLKNQLDLQHFAEPSPRGGDRLRAERYRRVPWFHIMEWRKRADGSVVA